MPQKPVCCVFLFSVLLAVVFSNCGLDASYFNILNFINAILLILGCYNDKLRLSCLDKKLVDSWNNLLFIYLCLCLPAFHELLHLTSSVYWQNKTLDLG
jgi:hypothetical protein